MIPLVVDIDVEINQTEVEISLESNLVGVDTDLSAPIITYLTPYYEGAYHVTPTNHSQVLDTSEMRMHDNVTIDPIPSNYGLITWNGSFITVS